MPRFNLANRITLIRLLFALVALVFLTIIQESIAFPLTRSATAWVCITFFILATALDGLDGYIARRDNTVTAFGRIADPFVDKAVVGGSLIYLAVIPETAAYLRPWMVAAILIREFLVNGIRGYMESQGIQFAAVMTGKVKMVLQSLLVGFLMGVIAFQPIVPWWVHYTSVILVWSTVGLTVYSGFVYVQRAARNLGSSDI